MGWWAGGYDKGGWVLDPGDSGRQNCSRASRAPQALPFLLLRGIIRHGHWSASCALIACTHPNARVHTSHARTHTHTHTHKHTHTHSRTHTHTRSSRRRPCLACGPAAPPQLPPPPAGRCSPPLAAAVRSTQGHAGAGAGAAAKAAAAAAATAAAGPAAAAPAACGGGGPEWAALCLQPGAACGGGR